VILGGARKRRHDDDKLGENAGTRAALHPRHGEQIS
jgi:hypothetical protein